MKWFVAAISTLAAVSGTLALVSDGWAATRWMVLSLGMLAGLLAVLTLLLFDQLHDTHRRPVARVRRSGRCSLCRVVREQVETVRICLTCDSAPSIADDSITLL